MKEQTLPCDVIVTQITRPGQTPLFGTVIKKGCQVNTLMACLEHRRGFVEMAESGQPFSYPVELEGSENLASFRQLVEAEISDFFAGGQSPTDESIDLRDLTARIMRCIPSAFGWGKPTPVEWQAAQDMADHINVDCELRNFTEDPTGDNGVRVVHAVMQVLNGEK